MAKKKGKAAKSGLEILSKKKRTLAYPTSEYYKKASLGLLLMAAYAFAQSLSCAYRVAEVSGNQICKAIPIIYTLVWILGLCGAYLATSISRSYRRTLYVSYEDVARVNVSFKVKYDAVVGKTYPVTIR